MARTETIRDGRDTYTITEQSTEFYVIDENFAAGSTYSYSVQVTKKGLVLSDGDSTERHLAIRLLERLGRKDLADLIRKRKYQIT